jgi:hypothetical protein
MILAHIASSGVQNGGLRGSSRISIRGSRHRLSPAGYIFRRLQGRDCSTLAAKLTLEINSLTRRLNQRRNVNSLLRRTIFFFLRFFRGWMRRF